MEPQPETLYHYCSSEAFTSIVRSQTIWLSALSLSNDSMEGQIVKATIMQLAERDGLSDAVRERLRESLAFSERFFEGLGFCLSEKGELLSQWRGYADDAKGLAIGFDRERLEALAQSTWGKASPGFSLYKVVYDKHQQLVEPTYQQLRASIDAGAFKLKGSWSLLEHRTPEQIAEDDRRIEEAHRDLIIKLLQLLPKLYELKTKAFSEEREWRLVSMWLGTQGDPCLFRSAGNRILPYRAFPLGPQDSSIISEVILGPRHQTPPSVIQSFLKQSGYGDVPVRQSDATYR